MYLTLTDTITLDESGPRSNSNEGILHTLQVSRTEASPLDAVKCYTQDNSFQGWNLTLVEGYDSTPVEYS